MMSVDDLYQNLLTQIRDDQLEELDLYHSKLGKERICELVKELTGNKSVKVVWSGCCGLGPLVAGVLCDMLKVNTSVTKLILSGNGLGDEGVRHIVEALKVNQFVKGLSLGLNSIGSDGARAIGKMLSVNKTLKELDLSKNSLGPEGVRAVAEALKVNQNVEVLWLSYNDISTEGAKAICEALKVNCCLKTLYLYGNTVGAEGARALLDALQVNGSLCHCDVDVFQGEVDAFLKRNFAMHKRAAESVMYLLALKTTRRILWIPKEIMVMISMALWQTKCDVEAWDWN